MKILAIFSLLLLSGCSTIGLLPKFPEVPDELTKPCPDLIEMEPTVKMSYLLLTVTDNYTRYHECQQKVDLWNTWYKEQKANYGKINEEL